MSASRRLWFHIEHAISDIQRLCRDARAEELKAREPEQIESKLPASEFDVVTEEIPGSLVRGETVALAGPIAVDIVALRAEIRKRLLWLKGKLSETLTEREAYYALFPVVIYTDELVQSAIEGAANMWRPFQMELFHIDNGGESFYLALDELLKKEETLPLIFEVFYFCLSDGFRGQYLNDPTKIEEYKTRLGARIHVDKLPAEGPPVDSGEVELIEFPARYYLGAAGAVAMLFFVLWLSAG
jgi:type IV/VI secretion system ImpK/VasF family protein